MDIGSLYNISDSDSGQVVADGLKANFEALVNEVNGKQTSGDYVTNIVLESKNYVTKSELPDTSLFATKEELNWKQDVGDYVTNATLDGKNYATKGEIPDISNLVSNEELEAKGYALSSEIPDISGLATKEELGQINGVLDKINGEVI